jgi:tripartite-type tricarboxylate transporter receptor subunit TctC
MSAVMRRTLEILVLAMAATLMPVRNAAAQDFPLRPVHLIVPYAPGGSGDLIARLLGDKLSTLWDQQVVVENRPGAGGLIGTETAARAPADGYTLYLGTDGPLTIAATLNGHVPYDWKRDFTPVSMITVGYQVLIVDPKLPVHTLTDFIAFTKSQPGKLNFASIGVGTAPHLAAELFISAAQLNMTHVPYNGSSAQAIRAMIAGDVAMFMVGTSTAVPFIQNGNVRALAVTSAASRVDGLPDVPTFVEAGLPQVDYSLWFAILVPSGTPANIVRALNMAIAKVIADPDYQKALKTRGFEARRSTTDELAVFMEKDYVKNRNLILKLGLHVD